MLRYYSSIHEELEAAISDAVDSAISHQADDPIEWVADFMMRHRAAQQPGGKAAREAASGAPLSPRTPLPPRRAKSADGLPPPPPESPEAHLCAALSDAGMKPETMKELAESMQRRAGNGGDAL